MSQERCEISILNIGIWEIARILDVELLENLLLYLLVFCPLLMEYKTMLNYRKSVLSEQGYYKASWVTSHTKIILEYCLQSNPPQDATVEPFDYNVINRLS